MTPYFPPNIEFPSKIPSGARARLFGLMDGGVFYYGVG